MPGRARRPAARARRPHTARRPAAAAPRAIASGPRACRRAPAVVMRRMASRRRLPSPRPSSISSPSTLSGDTQSARMRCTRTSPACVFKVVCVCVEGGEGGGAGRGGCDGQRVQSPRPAASARSQCAGAAQACCARGGVLTRQRAAGGGAQEARPRLRRQQRRHGSGEQAHGRGRLGDGLKAGEQAGGAKACGRAAAGRGGHQQAARVARVPEAARRRRRRGRGGDGGRARRSRDGGGGRRAMAQRVRSGRHSCSGGAAWGGGPDQKALTAGFGAIYAACLNRRLDLFKQRPADARS